METLAERIRSRRVLFWMSQDEFARRVGVSRRQVLHWEKEGDIPSGESLKRICEVLEVSADWLITGQGWWREVHNANFFQKEQSSAQSKSGSRQHKVPVFCELPLNFERRAFPALEVVSEDAGAIAFSVKAEEFSPHYFPGDVLLMRRLNVRFNPGLTPYSDEFKKLNGVQVVAVLNGAPILAELNFKLCGGRRIEVRLESLSRGVKNQSISNNDDLLIQAVVYKCIRSL